MQGERSRCLLTITVVFRVSRRPPVTESVLRMCVGHWVSSAGLCKRGRPCWLVRPPLSPHPCQACPPVANTILASRTQYGDGASVQACLPLCRSPWPCTRPFSKLGVTPRLLSEPPQCNLTPVMAVVVVVARVPPWPPHHFPPSCTRQSCSWVVQQGGRPFAATDGHPPRRVKAPELSPPR